jgi:hypothetical protein
VEGPLSDPAQDWSPGCRACALFDEVGEALGSQVGQLWGGSFRVQTGPDASSRILDQEKSSLQPEVAFLSVRRAGLFCRPVDVLETCDVKSYRRGVQQLRIVVRRAASV